MAYKQQVHYGQILNLVGATVQFCYLQTLEGI
jgi:hypothetical protein